MTFRDLHEEADEGLLRRFHAGVLEPSFSADELVALDTLRENLVDGSALVTVALGDGGAPVGGIVGDWFEQTGVLLISYLAVRPDLRGRSIGSGLRARAVATWPAQKPVALVLAEVHDPRAWAGVESDDPVARLRLFERFEGRVLDLPFVQPALQQGTERVRGFLLLTFLVDDSVRVARAGGGDGVPAALVRDWIRAYYEVAEGAREPYDPELRELLDAAERTDPIAVLPLSELAARPATAAPPTAPPRP